MADAIVRYPARGQAPEIYATRLKFNHLDTARPQFTPYQPVFPQGDSTLLYWPSGQSVTWRK